MLLSDDWGTAKVADVGVAQLLGNYNPENVGWTCVLAHASWCSSSCHSGRPCWCALAIFQCYLVSPMLGDP